MRSEENLMVEKNQESKEMGMTEKTRRTKLS